METKEGFNFLAKDSSRNSASSGGEGWRETGKAQREFGTAATSCSCPTSNICVDRLCPNLTLVSPEGISRLGRRQRVQIRTELPCLALFAALVGAQLLSPPDSERSG